MGNAHGHRKHHNGASNPGSSAFKYGQLDQAVHAPSSTNTNMESSSFLPYAHVDASLRALAAQAEGFGRCAIGGLHGSLYHVTTLAGYLSSTFFCLNFDVCSNLENLELCTVVWKLEALVVLYYLDEYSK